MLGVEAASVCIFTWEFNLFSCRRVEVVGQYFFDESGAMYICVEKYNEYENF